VLKRTYFTAVINGVFCLNLGARYAVRSSHLNGVHGIWGTTNNGLNFFKKGALY